MTEAQGNNVDMNRKAQKRFLVRIMKCAGCGRNTKTLYALKDSEGNKVFVCQGCLRIRQPELLVTFQNTSRRERRRQEREEKKKAGGGAGGETARV